MKLVYKYALAAPHKNSDLVEQQLRAAHRYRNVLTEIERGRRAAVRAVEAEVGDMQKALATLAAAQTKREAAVEAITRHRAKTRKRNEPAELKTAAKLARQAERDAAAAFHDLRRRLAEDPTVIAAKDAIGERALELIRSARNQCGVSWGTYLLVEAAAGDAFSDTSLYSLDGNPTDPRFQRWTGEGEVGVQLQGGLSADEASKGADTQLRITLPDPRAWDRTQQTHRECEQWARQAELSMRIESEGRKPIWASWRMDMHRSLPPGSTIKWAVVHRVQVGPYSQWYVTLTLDVPASFRRPSGIGTVAVDVGWRVIGDEMRIAGWQDADGQTGELRLSARDIAVLCAPEQMRSERDVRFDVARARLLGWLRQRPQDLPDWLTKATSTLHAWRSEARLAALWSRWSMHRFSGDASAYDALTSWQARARHEWAVESRARKQALRRRREKYRVWAARLAEKYDTIVIEKFDKRRVAERPAADRQPAQNAEQIARDESARSNRVLASTSELCDSIVMAARSRRCAVPAMPCADTTRTCPVCGLVESRDAAASVTLLCECGATWDQDVTGAPAVLLARWRERPGDAKMLVSARDEEKLNENGEKKESRWERARRLRGEKEARMKRPRREASDGAE
jgi:hypothetical protein